MARAGHRPYSVADQGFVLGESIAELSLVSGPGDEDHWLKGRTAGRHIPITTAGQISPH